MTDATARHAWVLNLDADTELSTGRRRDPFAAIAARPALVAALAALTGEGLVLSRGERAPEGSVGRAFCPTPSALEAMARAGARAPRAPGVEVLRAVADRRFAFGLPGGVPGATAVGSEDGAREAAARLGAGDGGWVLKRLWSFAGRGRLLGRGPTLDTAARGFVARALEEDGGLVAEPWLARLADLAAHGFVEETGAIRPGRPTRQETTVAGGWRATHLAAETDLEPGEADALRALVLAGGAALRDAGYFGPFGVDAIRHAGSAGSALARCEINPRYTMGWAIGMGVDRPDLGS